MWIRIHLGPWIRIHLGFAEFNQQFLFPQEIIFFKSEPKKLANLQGFGSDLKIKIFFLL